MAVTGTVFDDKNGNGNQDAGEPGLAGLLVTIVEAPGGYLDGFTGQATTDKNGFYSINSTGMGATNYVLQVHINDEWTSFMSNPLIGTIGPNDVWNFPMIPRCTRVASSWLTKVCYIPGAGVRVTFKDRKKLFTCLYPGTTLTDYIALIDAASKGRWIHWFYDKKRMYVPWPTSP